MKRLIAAVSFAVIASPVLASPFEQTELDRQLPNISVNAPSSYVADSSAPFEQNELDRSLPSLGLDNVRYAAASGSTMSDAGMASDAGTSFADDHNVISPAQ